MSQNNKVLIKDILGQNFVFLLDIYDRYMSAISAQNAKLEGFLKGLVDK